MLTKDKLRFLKRNSKVYPGYLDSKDKEVMETVASMIDIMNESQGLRVIQLNHRLSQLPSKDPKINAGLQKLLLDRCNFIEPEVEIEDFRWQVFAASKTALENGEFESLKDYQDFISERMQLPIQKLQEDLYSDLPDFKQIAEFKSISPGALIHRYNAALIQGLLIQAKEMEVVIENPDIQKLRYILRQIKFHQLLVAFDMNKDKSKVILTISGPLSILDKAQTYGLKMANFFPHLLNLKKWSMLAQIKIKSKTYNLEVGSNNKIESHYADHAAYIPDEIKACIHSFNKENKDYEICDNSELLNLGDESYSFPDLVIKRKNSEQVSAYIELFHRWHSGQLKHRLSQLESYQSVPLKIGVDRQALKARGMKTASSQSQYFKDHGFTFSGFPTVKHFNQCLS